MKKLIFLILIFTQITSPAFAEEVIDVFEEYASYDDFVCKTYSFSLSTAKNEEMQGDFFTDCSLPYTVYVTSTPENGDINLKDNKFVYTPNENYTGSDSFQYRIYANGVYSNISECSINVVGEEIPETNFYYEDMKDHKARTAAEKMVEMNIIKGERVGAKYYFYPESPITRGCAISYLCAALDIKTDKKSVPVVFADDNSLSEQQKKDAYICYSAGIIVGKSKNNKTYLCPDELLTRAEMFSMLDRAYAGKTNSDMTLLYPDSKEIPDYSKQNIKNLITNGFLENSKTKLLRPNDYIKKADFCELLYKLVLSNEESAAKTFAQRIKEGFYANLIT